MVMVLKSRYAPNWPCRRLPIMPLCTPMVCSSPRAQRTRWRQSARTVDGDSA